MVVMFKRRLCALLLLVSFGSAATCDWPAWQQFKHDYVSDAGRVIDPSSARKVTTSEGQSYGLFFALVVGEKQGVAGAHFYGVGFGGYALHGIGIHAGFELIHL